MTFSPRSSEQRGLFLSPLAPEAGARGVKKKSLPHGERGERKTY
jgi:hypothetical protein